MLKLGCMSLSYKDEFGADILDLEQFIERAYQLRLDGIDLHTRAFASLSGEGVACAGSSSSSSPLR